MLLETVDRPLEPGILERLDLPAAVADEMVMVLAAGAHGLEARDPRAEVDPLEQPLGREQLEHAVDARDPDLAPGGAQTVEDLLGGQAAVLPGEQLDYRSTRPAVPQALPVERLEGRLSPLAHALMIAALRKSPG